MRDNIHDKYVRRRNSAWLGEHMTWNPHIEYKRRRIVVTVVLGAYSTEEQGFCRQRTVLATKFRKPPSPPSPPRGAAV